MTALRPWADVRETHTAVVLLVGDRAYKVKKPVDLGFLDFRDLGARRSACEEEVRLNRRFSPDVYVGVAELVDWTGATVDHLVVMRRMPDERRLSTLVRDRSSLVPGGVRQVARVLADYHAGARRFDGPDSPGGSAAVVDRWRRELDDIEAVARGVVGTRTLSAIRTLATDYLDGRAVLFDERVAAGLVRDGHGDLLADDVFLLDDGPRLLDCLEFDERLRVGDVWLDAAFLAMDLERLGDPTSAHQFVADYREFSAAPVPESLVHFYVADRARVRAKVAALRAGQGEGGARRRAASLAALCLRHLEAATVTLTLVGGLPGSGKTTLSTEIAPALDAVCISSDPVRGALQVADEGGEDRWATGRYAADVTERVYAVLLERAATALARGESVVLDASWRCAAHRELARRLAARTRAVLTQVECRVTDDVAARWLAGRHDDASEATMRTRLEMRSRWQRWPDATTVDPTAVDAAAVADVVRRRVRRHSHEGGSGRHPG